MSNYLIIPKHYNTGYLTENSNLRIKQGLDPQQIANACAYLHTSFTLYSPNTNLKPAQQVLLNYGLPEIPNNCPCTKYLQRI